MAVVVALVEFFIAIMILFPLFCSGFPAVLTLERAFPLSPQPDLDMLMHRDRVRHARVNPQPSTSSRVIDFHLQGTFQFGLYFTRIQLGSPPRDFLVQIDSGSDILWISCKSCEGCPSVLLPNPCSFYDPQNSSTANLVGCSDRRCRRGCSAQNGLCTYTFQYADESLTSGYYVSDLLHFETILANSKMTNATASIVFGCSTRDDQFTMPFWSIDGILGLGQSGLSVISQLTSQKIAPRAFSHCLRGDDNGGGLLVLGAVTEPNMVYTPIVPSQPHYNVNLQSIYVNGRRVPIDPSIFATSNNRGTIIDSGTTLAYLVDEAYDPFVHAVTTVVSQVAHPFLLGQSQCYTNLSSVSMDVFPEVRLDFEGGASLLLDPQDYLRQTISPDGASAWCLGFHKSQGLGLTLLGAQRIGWANYNCSMQVNISTIKMVNSWQNNNTSSHKHSISPMVSPLWTTQLLIMALSALWINLRVPAGDRWCGL